MKYIAGDVADHDHEVTEARWVKMDEAIEMLDFESEKEVVKKAKDLLANYQEK
jgi:NADH pyrophosphatase NudC (nudix superfamily)